MRSKTLEDALRITKLYFELREPITSEKLSRKETVASRLNEILADNSPDLSASVSWDDSNEQVIHTIPELLALPLSAFLDIQKLKKEADLSKFERGQLAWIITISYFQQALNEFQKDIYWSLYEGNQLLNDGVYWLGQANEDGIAEAQALWKAVSLNQPYTPMTFELEGKKLFSSFYSRDEELENTVNNRLREEIKISNHISNSEAMADNKMPMYVAMKQALYLELGLQKNKHNSKELAQKKLLDEARIAMKEGCWLKGMSCFEQALLLDTGLGFEHFAREINSYKINFKSLLNEVNLFDRDKLGKILADLFEPTVFIGSYFADYMPVTKEIMRDLVFKNPSDDLRKALLIRALGFDLTKTAAENTNDPLYKILHEKRMKSSLFEESMVTQFEKALFALDKSYSFLKGKPCYNANRIEDFENDFMSDYVSQPK